MDITRENNSAAVDPAAATAPAGASAEEACRDKCKSRHCHRNNHHRNTFVAVVVFNLFHLALANPVFVNNPSLAQFQSGRNIRHLPCIVRKSGLSGVCMFAIDCIKSNGTHLGTCIDRFYFGSCCQMKDESLYLAQEISDNSIDQNTISHFPHEATTVPTSALFKLTTQSYIGSSAHTSQEYSSSTERLTNNVPYIPISTVIPPQRLEISTIRANTTSDSSKTPSVTPTVTKSSSTTSSVVLTTTSIPKRTTSRTTTETPKFTTFQVVERDETTTIKPVRRPQTTYPTKSTIKNTITTRNPPKPTKTRPVQTTTKRPPVRNTTPKQRPNTTRRPTTSKRPNSTKRPSSGTPARTPSRKPTTPVVLLTSSSKRNATVISTTKPVKPILGSSTTPIKPVYSSGTKAPRPRPKPTSQIVKVPPTTIKNDVEEKQDFTVYQPVFETTTPKHTTTTAPTTTIKFVDKTRTTTTAIPITTVTEKLTTKINTSPKTTTPTVTIPPTTTTSTTTTTEPSTTISSTLLVTKPTTTTTNAPLTSTIMTLRPVSSEDSLGVPVIESTTQKPGLVTWTNIDELKGNTTTQSNDINEDWQPRPPPPDWIPVPTIKPDSEQNKNDISSTFAATATEESTTDGNMKVSSSEPSTMGSEPTKEPMRTTTQPPQTAEINATTPLITLTTPWNEVTPLSTSTEKIVSMAPSATDSSVDDNTTLMASTQVPSLEGIDYRQVCGKRMFPEPRIVGGANAAFGRWPWQISLRQWRTSTYLHKCGAALLNENWAITAAHCVDNVPPSDLLLRLGEYDLAEEEEPYGYQERRVQIVASHPQFDPRTFEYDLALLRFYEPVAFQPNIIPVCVPDADADFIGETAYVTGWGRLYEDGPLPSVLQEVSVPVINNTICETMYRAAGYIEHIPHIFICAGWKKGGYDSCEGDSGGPMVLQRDDKRFLLAGIISWGIGCAEPNQPGVYTRISEFRDWINQILQF